MTTTLKLRVALLAGLLAGCSSGYAPPPPSSAASLQFVNQTGVPMAVHLYDEAAECKGRRALAALKPQEARVVFVPGDQDVAFAFTHDVKLDYAPFERVAAGCIATLSFKPLQGASYVFRMESDGHQCVYRFDAAPAGPEGRAAPVAFIKREAMRATSEAGPFCRK